MFMQKILKEDMMLCPEIINSEFKQFKMGSKNKPRL